MQDNRKPDNQQTTLASQRPVFRAPGEDARLNSAPTLPHNPPVTPYYTDPLRPPPPPVNSRESAARERMRRRRVRSRHGSEWAWVVIAGALFSVVLIISMSAFIMLRAAQTPAEFVPTAVVDLPTPVNARGGAAATGQQITLSDGRSIILTPWDGASRFTVIIAGLDRRPGETGLAYRTDTLLLASIDPAAQQLGLLSIPRDLYVEVPGYSELQRINTPMVLGELRQPGYGPTLMMQTTQYNLGIRVHDYVAVDFSTFITLIDAVGGIDINVPYDISDPQYPDMNFGYDPFYIRAGLQHLNGATALKYARTRHGDSDFQRAQRQQQVLYAMRDKVLSLNMLPQLIVQSPTLWSKLSAGVSTGLTLDQIIQLAWYLKDIPGSNLRTGVIDERYTMPYTTPSGAQVLVPDRNKLGPLMVEVFGDSYSK